MSCRISILKQTIVKTDFSFDSIRCCHPVQSTLYLPVTGLRSTTTSGFRIISTMDQSDISTGIFIDPCTFNNISTFQAYFLSRSKAEKFLRRIFHKIVSFDEKFPGKSHLTHSGIHIFRIILDFHIFRLSLMIIIDDHFHRIEHCHHPRSRLIQMFTDTIFQQRHIHDDFPPGHSHLFSKHPNRFGGITTPAQSANSRHSGIVPTGNILFLYQFQQTPFTHHCIIQVATGEFNLPWPVLGRCQLIQKPIVKRPMNLKFQRTDRMSDSFEIVTLSMSKVVHRIDAPPITGSMMATVDNPVHDRVTHQHIGSSHIDLSPQHPATFRELSIFHPPE